MWPNFKELKESLEKWLNSNHPNYIKELGRLEWANAFSGRHHSMVVNVNYKKCLILNN